MNPSSWFDVGGDSGLRVVWEDGDRVFRRGWRDGAEGAGTRFWLCFPLRSTQRVTASIA